MIRLGGLVLALLLGIVPVTAPAAGSGHASARAEAGARVPSMATVGNESATARDATLCRAVRRQVVAWSRRQGRGRDLAHVVAIRRMRLVANRLPQSPANGVLLRCVGRAKLSNGLTAPVAFGMAAVDGTWYLFLKKVRL